MSYYTTGVLFSQVFTYKKLHFYSFLCFFLFFLIKNEQFEVFKIKKFKLFVLFINVYDNFNRARNWSAFAFPITLSKSRV